MNSDFYYLKQAISAAKKGYGFVSPNPMVGAVLVSADNQVFTSYHKQYAENHAERDLLLGLDIDITAGATLYVSLQPCCHIGKTAACTDIIISKKIKRVVYASKDLNGLVANKSDAILELAGVKVDYIPIKSAYRLNRKFLKWISTGKPYICLKFACSVNGLITDESTDSKQLVGDDCKKYVYKMRQGYDAILVGSQTVLNDNPNLGLHSLPSRKEIFRLVLSSDLNFFEKNSRLNVFRDQNFAILSSIDEVFEFCGKNKISSLYVEGGAKVISSFMKLGLFDELNVFVASKVISKGLNFLTPNFELNVDLKFESVKKFNNDVLINYTRI